MKYIRTFLILIQLYVLCCCLSCSSTKYIDIKSNYGPIGYFVDSLEIQNPIIVYYDKGVYVVDSSIINNEKFNIKEFVKDSINYICGDVPDCLIYGSLNNFRQLGREKLDQLVMEARCPTVYDRRKDSKGNVYYAYPFTTQSTKFYLTLINVDYYNRHTYLISEWDPSVEPKYRWDPEFEIRCLSPQNDYVKVVFQRE